MYTVNNSPQISSSSQNTLQKSLYNSPNRTVNNITEYYNCMGKPECGLNFTPQKLKFIKQKPYKKYTPRKTIHKSKYKKWKRSSHWFITYYYYLDNNTDKYIIYNNKYWRI